MAVNGATNAPLAVPRSAAERRSKRRMFEHREVRVRRGRRSASIAGESDEQEVRSTTAIGAWSLATFCRNRKWLVRRVGERNHRDNIASRE